MLRKYQVDAVDRLFDHLATGPGDSHPCISMPTGSGKSLVIAEICRRAVQEHGASVVVATHRAELIRQDAQAIRRLWPEAPVGIYSASVGDRDVTPITVCGVQSMVRRAEVLGHRDLVIIDEAHLVSPKSDGQYARLFDALRAKNAEVRRIGITATPYRLGQGLLTQGDGALFSSIIVDVPVGDLVRDGYLAPLVSGDASAAIDVSGVATSLGDYALADLEMASDVDAVDDAVALDVAGHMARGRTSALIYGVTLRHAANLRNALRAAGISCELVEGATSQAERQRIYDDFKARRLQAIASCDVLTTGFDAPVVDVLVMVRATKSTSLYVQMMGRGTRLSEGKRDCLVLDYCGNIARHGPIDKIKVRPKQPRQEPGEAPQKACEQCGAEVHASLRTCPYCGAVFPPPERKANAAASKLPPMSISRAGAVLVDEKKEEWQVPISHVEYSVHRKKDAPDAPPSMRVTYYMAKTRVSDFICVEHSGYAHTKACDWWRRNTTMATVPNVDGAVAACNGGACKPFSAVVVRQDGEYLRVVRHVHDAPLPVASDVMVPSPPAWHDDTPTPSGIREALGRAWDDMMDDDLPF